MNTRAIQFERRIWLYFILFVLSLLAACSKIPIEQVNKIPRIHRRAVAQSPSQPTLSQMESGDVNLNSSAGLSPLERK